MELVSLICNHDKDMSQFDEIIECGGCGNIDKAKYYYLCDECNELMSEMDMDEKLHKDKINE